MRTLQQIQREENCDYGDALRIQIKERESSFAAPSGSAKEAAVVPEVEWVDGAEHGDFPCRLHRSLYKKSDDPEHADNRENREFLDGYAEGYSSNRANGLDGIADEWERRGCPEELAMSFREWKRGYNAGSMRRSWEGVMAKASAMKPGHVPSEKLSDCGEQI